MYEPLREVLEKTPRLRFPSPWDTGPEYRVPTNVWRACRKTAQNPESHGGFSNTHVNA